MEGVGVEVPHARAQPPRVQAEPVDVDGWFEQFRGNTSGEERRAAVALHDVPLAIHRDGRERLVGLEDHRDGLLHDHHVGPIERAFLVHGSKARRQQEPVLFAQGEPKLMREQEHHLAAWRRAPGLYEAEVPRGNARADGEFELAQASNLAPVPKLRPEAR